MIIFFTISLFTIDKYTGELIEYELGAHALALGFAYTPLANDVTAFYWNPAGIAENKISGVSVSRIDRFSGLGKIISVGLSKYFTSTSTGLAIGVNYFGVDSIPQTEIDPEDSTNFIVKNYLNPKNFTLYLVYSRRLSMLSFGVGTKLIYFDYILEKAYGIGADFGLLYSYADMVDFGLKVSNSLGTMLVWTTGRKVYIPPVLQYGVCVRNEVAQSGEVIFVIQFDTNLEWKPSELEPLYTDSRIGLEYIYKNIFGIRVGKTPYGISFGAGIKYGALSADYGLMVGHELGSNLCVSIGLRL